TFFESSLKKACNCVAPILEKCDVNHVLWLKRLLKNPWHAELTCRVRLQQAATNVLLWSLSMLPGKRANWAAIEYRSHNPSTQPEEIAQFLEEVHELDPLVREFMFAYSEFSASVLYQEVKSLTPLALAGQALREAQRQGGVERAQQRKNQP